MSKQKREKAIRLLATGMSASDTARKLGVSRQLVSYWAKNENFQEALEKSKADLAKKQACTAPKITEDFIYTRASEIPSTPSLHSQKARQTQSVSNTEALREQELVLLEKIQQSLMPQLEEGCFRSATLMLKLSERRSKLLGLDRKNLEVIEAFQVLAEENLLSPTQLESMSNLVAQFREQLKNSLLPS